MNLNINEPYIKKINIKGVAKNNFLIEELKPVYLTLISIITNKRKLYMKILVLLKNLFFELNNNNDIINDITGI